MCRMVTISKKDYLTDNEISDLWDGLCDMALDITVDHEIHGMEIQAILGVI